MSSEFKHAPATRFGLSLNAVLVYLFLYAPIVTLVVSATYVTSEDSWFEKSFLLNRKNEAERINLPRKVSIARQLIDGWLGEVRVGAGAAPECFQ